MSATLTDPATAAPVCRLDELPAGIGRTFDIAGRRIALFRTRQGMIFATDAACPHAGAPLADGIVAGGCIVCPYHARRFDLATGQCDDAKTASIRSYPVSVHGEWVSVTCTERMKTV
jgi:nitrite reductase (NADH) small subunit